MAAVIHTEKTLGDVEDDLREIMERVAAIRKKMKTNGIAELPIDFQKMQVNGRLWLHRFASDGEERLRESIVRKSEVSGTKAKK
jgi:hypothetical protein